MSDAAALGTCVNLRFLSLRHTKVKDLSPLSHLHLLKHLDLNWTPVVNITPLVPPSSTSTSTSSTSTSGGSGGGGGGGGGGSGGGGGGSGGSGGGSGGGGGAREQLLQRLAVKYVRVTSKVWSPQEIAEELHKVRYAE